MKRLLGYFFQGLIYLAPIAITIIVLYKSFVFLDGLFIGQRGFVDLDHFLAPEEPKERASDLNRIIQPESKKYEQNNLFLT